MVAVWEFAEIDKDSWGALPGGLHSGDLYTIVYKSGVTETGITRRELLDAINDQACVVSSLEDAGQSGVLVFRGEPIIPVKTYSLE